jgi:hypothetical protein
VFAEGVKRKRKSKRQPTNFPLSSLATKVANAANPLSRLTGSLILFLGVKISSLFSLEKQARRISLNTQNL